MPSINAASWWIYQVRLLFGPRHLSTMSKPTHRFVLFGTEFSGGRLVVDLLRRVADARYGPLPITWSVESLLERRHFFPLRHIQHHQLACPDYAFGFKLSAADLITTHQMSEPHRFLELLHSRGYKIIQLRRRDLMRHGIAILRAQHPKKQQINPDELLATIKQLDEQRVAEAAILARVPHLTITYETDLLDPNVYKATAQRLCYFLELKQRQRPQYPVKLVHRSMADLVENYDEVQAALAKSDYAYVLAAASTELVI